MNAIQRHLVARNRSRFAAVAGVDTPAAWECDFVSPFWDAFLLSRTVDQLRPRFVLGQEVHSHGLAAAWCRCPKALFPWGSDIHTVVETSWPMFRLVRTALRAVDLVVPTAQTARGYLTARFGVAPERVVPMSWGVDRSRFRPPTSEEKTRLRERHGIPSEAPVVLNIRRFLPQWNSEVVLGAFLAVARRFPDSHFILIGGRYADATLDAARAAIDEAGLAQRFHLYGELSISEFADVLRTADVFTSMNPRFDMRSVSILQGIACGLVPIVHDDQECRAMRADGFDAVLVREGTLEETIAGTMTGRRGFESMIARNLEYVAAHEDSDRQMDALLHLLLERLGPRE